MSLLDENLDIDCVEVFKSHILYYLRTSHVFEYRRLYNLPRFDTIEFKECNWNHIIAEPYKYYIYIKIDCLNLYIHIGKIHERLSDQKYGANSSYIIVSKDDKYINIKQVSEYDTKFN